MLIQLRILQKWQKRWNQNTSDFFNTRCADKIKKKYGTADIVFARNVVVPHVKDILS